MPRQFVESYRRYCRNYEKECMKAGLQHGVWQNKESEAYFGHSSDPGDFFGPGSGGWKLEAIKDYMEDLASVKLNFRILRISVYDTIMINNNLTKVGSILEIPNHPQQEYLLKNLIRKINSQS